MSKQQVHCPVCASIMHTSFLSEEAETCKDECNKELLWRKDLASEGKPYRPRKKMRFIRIAELDPVDELDHLIEDLKRIPDLSIARYLIPQDVYHLFASNPPPIGLDFPIATLEGEWSDRLTGAEGRVFGYMGVQALLREIRISSFAVTRKIKRSSVNAAIKDMALKNSQFAKMEE